MNPLRIVLISVHGLVRGHDLELGRDADTGGQVKYVVELARALGEREDVEDVMLITRRVVDEQVSPDYAVPVEVLADKVRIVRIECGEEAYLPKEYLWDCLDSFADNVAACLRAEPRYPDIIHSHYADAGYVGSILSRQLGVPLVHTGHSLGRSKRVSLLAAGQTHESIERLYNISRRIEAEETTLAVAGRIITSTRQEIEQQYGAYDFYMPERMCVVPPGTDMSRFTPPTGDEWDRPIAREVARFLHEPRKPMILALSRPDPKKNIVSLIQAYGESPALQQVGNLVIVAGNRDDIRDLDDGARGVIRDILCAVDRYDLYGRVAYPKHHSPDEVPDLFRLAAASRGVFVNPALTEPFGLTLLEAAASGLPLVATEDGGPLDIVGNCENGHLIDPLDTAAMAETMHFMLTSSETWNRFSDNGRKAVSRLYTWQAHAERYMQVIRPLVDRTATIAPATAPRRRGIARKQAVFAGLDLNLVGGPQSLQELLRLLHEQRKRILFGITTGRCLDDALATMRRHRIPKPDVLITGQGSEIHYTSSLTQDVLWKRHINHLWEPDAVHEILDGLPGLKLQPRKDQGEFKISYYIDPELIGEQDVRQLLVQGDQTVNAMVSFGQYLDVLPIRASKGLALRWCSGQLDFPLDNTLVAGVTGADADMLRGNTLGTVVDSRHTEELQDLASMENIYFATASCASGILEAMDHYGFLQEDGQ